MIDETDRDVVDETKKFGKRGYFGKETFTGNLSGGEDSISNGHLCEEGHKHDRTDRAESVSVSRVDEVSVHRSEKSTHTDGEQKPGNKKVAAILILMGIIMMIPNLFPVSAFLIFVAMFIIYAEKDDKRSILTKSFVSAAFIMIILVIARTIITSE